MSTKPSTVSDRDFDRFINQHELAVVDFWAEWCPPCRMLAPIIDELAAEFAGKIAFAKLNTDQNPAIPVRYEITAIPTLLVFKHGKLVDRIVGFRSKSQLKSKLEEYLS